MRQILAARPIGDPEGFFVQRTLYGRNFADDPGCDLNPFLCLVEHGSYKEKTPHGWRDRCESSLHFHPAGELKNSVYGSQDTVVLALSISEKRFNNLGPIPQAEVPNVQSGPIITLMRQVAACLDSTRTGIGLLIEARSIEAYYEFINLVSNGCPKPPEWFPLAQTLLQENRSVDDVAHICGIHPASFARSFRRWAGCRPAQFSLRCRLEKAKSMLEEGETRIGCVASEAGFCDQSHLAKEFKRQYGLSPRAFARSR